MTRQLTCLAAGLLLLAACGEKAEGDKAAAGQAAQDPAATAAPVSPPRRKPGLWEQRVSMAGMDQVTRLCVDDAVEDKLSWWGQQATRDMCAKTSMKRRLDGAWEIASECEMGSGGKTVTTGLATGDFSSAYRHSAFARSDKISRRRGRSPARPPARRDGPRAARASPGRA